MRCVRRFLAVTGLVLLALGLVGCGAQLSAGVSGGKGNLRIGLSDMTSRTLVPGISMEAEGYTVTGTGPGGVTFTESIDGGAVTKGDLVSGTWTVVVNALNASGTRIGTGTATAEVAAGETATVSVTVSPIPGTGTLSLEVSWRRSQVQNPSITATLTPALGTAQSLAFTVGDGSASYSTSAIGAGYYTLALTLNDNGAAVAGAVEVVRIVTGAATDGSYDFQKVNSPGGNIHVNINVRMEDPLLVAISDSGGAIPAGSTAPLTAGVLNYEENLIYVWYVNGASAGIGETFDFGRGLPVGYYRVDVTAFSADGKRAGSSTRNIQVISPTPSGSDWTQESLPSRAHWSSVAFGNGIFVAITDQQNDRAAISVDGATWTETRLPSTADWGSVVFGNGVFLAAETNGGQKAATSTDGINWTARTLPSYAVRSSLAFGNGVFVAINPEHTAISSNGISWTDGGTPPGGSGSGYSVAYGNGRFVAVDRSSDLTLASADGTNWTTGALPAASNAWGTSVTYGGGKFLAVGNTDVAAFSADGVTWTPSALPETAYWTGAIYGNGIFAVFNSHQGTVATSPDGTTWSTRSIPMSAFWLTAAFGNGIFVVLADGNNGDILISR